jgi:hypothetical protein
VNGNVVVLVVDVDVDVLVVEVVVAEGQRVLSVTIPVFTSYLYPPSE